MSFPKNLGKNISINRSKNLNGKYSQKLLDHAKKSGTGAFKTALERPISKTAKATGDLSGNEIANKITKISKTSQQNNSETTINEDGEEISKERYISPEERQKIIDDLR